MRGDDAAAPFADEARQRDACRPRAKIDCVVSIISSKRSVPAGSSRQYSKASHAEASAATWSGEVIFGQRDDEVGRQRAARSARAAS